MTNYLITGGAGFIGSNFIHLLMKKYGNSINIINLDSLNYCGNRDNVSMYEGNDNYEFIHDSICNETAVKSIFAKHDIDYVVHFAAQTHVDRSITSAKEFVDTNVCGTLTLLDAAKDAWEGKDLTRKRFLYISTDEVYGELPPDGYFTEETPLCPRNPYSASKASGDMIARSFYETHGLPILVTRCSNNYGPYQFEEKLIPLSIKNCLSGKEIPVYGNGENIRDWIYVEDHCKGIDLVLNQGVIGEIYNIGGHNEYTNLKILEMIRSILKDEFNLQPSPLRFVADRKGHDKRYAMDPSKIMSKLGWKAETSFEDGIRQTIRWYIDHKDFLNL